MTNGTETKRRLPDGSTMHMLSLPDDIKVTRYITPELRAKLDALSLEYTAAQTATVPDLITGQGQVHKGASMFIVLRSILDDAESGQHSESLQRSHDSKNRLRKWTPVFEQIQQQLIEIEDARNSLLTALLEELRASKDYSERDAVFPLSCFLSANS